MSNDSADSLYDVYLRVLNEERRMTFHEESPNGDSKTVWSGDDRADAPAERLGSAFRTDARPRNDPRTFQPTPMGLFYDLVSFELKRSGTDGADLESMESAFDDMTNRLRTIEDWMKESPENRKRMAEFKESNPNAFRCFDEFVSLAAATEKLLGTCQRIAAEESDRRMYAATHSPQNDSSFSQANKFNVVVEPNRTFGALFVDPVAKLALRLKGLIQANAEDSAFSAVADEIAAAYDRVSAADDSLEGMA